MNRVKIDRRWLPLNALRAFEAVARHGSFTAAANALQISQSALSRHVLGLEGMLGTQLFDRKPQALTLTSAGQHLLPPVTKAFDRIEYSLDEIRQVATPPLRTLRVQFTATFAVQLAAPLLRDFRRIHPEVEINLVSSYAVGPPANDVDIAVVYSKPMVTERVSDLLWPVRMGILCHPEVAKRHAGKDLAAFINDNELIHMRIDGMPRHHFWMQLKRAFNLGTVNVERGLVFDTELLAVQYALAGEGLALVDLALFREYLDDGRLVAPYDVTLDDGYGFYLITDSEDLGDPAVALFRSWMIERFGPEARLKLQEPKHERD
jgi:LysR family glycine cleavage system transcriptional activator